ncbi:MAG TPA: class I tRNA ligase family protein [Reyranella sp.]|jgi:leucyl-tRNA synthetase|nr:class I tRNA ligase family protein [Reyranella sp.]
MSIEAVAAESLHLASELRVQSKWRAAGIFEAEPMPGRPKWFVVELPPFANGKLHLGHLRNYAMGDVVARFRRMGGYNVLYTTGFDAFGLPNENAARDEGCLPAVMVERNIADMLRLFERLGLSHDVRRIIGDHEPRYYRWVQWLFLKLLAAGYAYRRKGLVNWCPTCRSTLAESLVEGGKCWRCAAPVQLVEMDRWYVRETDFIQPVLAHEHRLSGWPEAVKRIHRDWIGEREGVEITFRLDGQEGSVVAFTAEPESLADAAFVAVGTLHPLAVGAAAGRIVELGLSAIEPLSQRRLPIVLVRDDERVMEGETLLGCPANDARDRDIWQVLTAKDAPPPAVRPDRRDVTQLLVESGVGRPATRYRLRDWDIARPRYWGTPVPIVHCPACGPVPVPDEELPVLLPEDVDLSAVDNPLATSPSFVETGCPRCGAAARRDTDTIETYASPWWFYLTCRDPRVTSPFDSDSSAQWMPVDVMIGGSDQIRTCFFHLRTMAEAMTRLGIVDEPCPVKRLVPIGMVKVDGRKMSKSAGNAVDLAALLDRHGADVLRLAILSGAAPDQDINWKDDLIRKASRLVGSLTRLVERHRVALADLPAVAPAASKRQRKLAKSVEAAQRAVSGSLERCAFHVAIQQLTFLVDRIGAFAQEAEEDDEIALGCAMRSVLTLAAPLAPHAAEDLWERSGGAGLVATAPWPVAII